MPVVSVTPRVDERVITDMEEEEEERRKRAYSKSL